MLMAQQDPQCPDVKLRGEMVALFCCGEHFEDMICGHCKNDSN